MRFLIDAQLPPSLARWLTAQGHIAEHVCDVLPATSKDVEIARFAAANGAVVITKDADFLDLTADPGLRLLLLGTGNLKNAVLLALFAERLAGACDAFEAGARVVTIP